MRLPLSLKAPLVYSRLRDVDVDALNLRETPTARVFSSWEAVSATSFDIATAVIAGLQSGGNNDNQYLGKTPTSSLMATDDHEDFGQPDTGSQISSAPHAHAWLKRVAAWANTKVLSHQATHPTHFAPRNPLPPITLPEFSIIEQRSASTGWIGLCDDGVSAQEKEAGVMSGGRHQLSDFFGPKATFSNFRLVKYLGPATRPIVDATGRVCAVFAGHEDDPGFMANVHDPAAEAMEAARHACSVSVDRTYHRRGNFTSLTTGQSHGGGQVQPGTFVNGVINAAVLGCLLSNVAFIRLAGFATGTSSVLPFLPFLTGGHSAGVFANFAPMVYDYYVINMRSVYSIYPHLVRPFINGIWSACTFNLGPLTCAIGHRDFANLAFGWCAITALGTFDYTKGGHLILWDCRLILEFPPGTTILIPSATIFHSNIPISGNERRYSFTQYTAGGLFRWVQHGFWTEEEYLASLSKEQKKAQQEEDRERYEDGVRYYSHISDLQ